MPEAVTFTIPGKITSANRVTRHVGRVALKSKSAREDHERVRMLAAFVAPWNGGQGPSLPLAAMAVTIVAYNSRLDADNLPKTILDGIRGVLIVNDSPKHLRRLVVEHRRDKLGERYEVTVAALTGEP